MLTASFHQWCMARLLQDLLSRHPAMPPALGVLTEDEHTKKTL
jgi:hypothetical protein